MRAGLAAAPTLLCGAVTVSWACTPALPSAQGTQARTLDSAQYALAYRTLPENIVIGQHFAMELALCAKGSAAAVDSLRVDAHMPEHRHGMNYKTVVSATGAQRYRAEGLMFHMPGRWEYIFEVRAAGAIERLTTSVMMP